MNEMKNFTTVLKDLLDLGTSSCVFTKALTAC